MAEKKKTRTYEAAKAELDAVIEKMSVEGVSMDELLVLCESGNELLKECESFLKAFESRVEKLRVKEDEDDE